MSAEIRDIARAPVIIGGGVAGLITALRLAPLPVVLLSKTPLGTEASSGWAQGGVAAAIGPDDDPALHCADTLAAGDGLCDPEIARYVTGSHGRKVAVRISAPILPARTLSHGARHWTWMQRCARHGR
jgi:aspartate oxidase